MKICESTLTMKTRLFRVCITAVAAGLLLCGCEQQQQRVTTGTMNAAKQIEAYGPEKLEVIALSELKPGSGDEEAPKLTLYVKALDAFGSAVKVPGVFRVELYESVARSPSPVGRRVEIWPDIDLVDPCQNNAQWRDHLRAYEFNFDVSSKLTPGHVYIVEVTCLSPMGKRMSVQHNLKF